MRTGFRISGLRHMISDTLKKKMGIRNYRILCSAMAVVLVAAVIIPILSNKKDESFAAGTISIGEKAVEVRFLNTQTKNVSKTYKSNEVNLIKTKDGKYVLIDTGDNDSKIRNHIYDTLRSYQGKDKVTIDWLIISHLDGDHYGNAATLINNNNIAVRNVVIKRENKIISTANGATEESKKNAGQKRLEAFNAIVNACKSEKDPGCEVYTNANNYDHKMDSEGQSIKVDDYLTLYFYNTVDVYGDDNKASRNYRGSSLDNATNGGDYVNGCTTGYYVKLASDTGKYLVHSTKNGEVSEYVRLDGGKYPNANSIEKIKAADFVDTNLPTNEFNRYFYAEFAKNDDEVTLKTQNSCRSNGNSYGILAEVNTNAGNKYMYFANDLDNFGYGVIPTNTNVKYFDKNGNLQQKTVGVYGNGRGVLLEKKYLKEKDGVETLEHPIKSVWCSMYKKSTSACDDMTDVNKVVGNKIAAESRVALQIKDKLGDSGLNNIVIYQQSHHGNNNAPDAINTLNLNRSGVYAIANRYNDMSGKVSGESQQYFIYLRSHYYALNNANKMQTGSKGADNGVYCAIDASGNYKCGYKPIVSGAIVYDANGGTGAPGSQTCLAESACSMTISSTKPTRDGYDFLGWSKDKNATTATYASGKSGVSISGNTTLYAVWKETVKYTLTYNANAGSDTVTNMPGEQTCTPVSGSCSLKVSSMVPSRTGYAFAGWDTVTTTLDGAYKPGSTININVPSRPLYAIWKRITNINTSVNGTGGTISSSVTGVEQGSTVVITFTPNAGYEIDNVKVDGEITEVTDNHLEIVASDEDTNVVVTFKKKAVDPTPDDPTPDDPTPDPTRTFRLSFSSANGGSGFPSAVTCTTTTDSCSVVIPSNPEPERTGYKFLGYGLFSNWSEVVATPGEQYTLTGNTSFLAIWAPDYKLTLNANGGEFPAGATTTLTCNPTTANGTCTVALPGYEGSPTKEGYSFFGYTTGVEGNSAEYVPGNEFTFTAGVRNVTLYAVWGNGGEVEWIQGQNYTNGTNIDLMVRIDYPIYNFRSLTIDGDLVDSSNYDIQSGSTIISVHSDYMDSLPDGEHTLVASYTNGINVITSFTTVTEHSDSDVPDVPGGDDDDDDDEDWDEPDGPTDPDDPTNPDNPTPDNPDTPSGPNTNNDEDDDDYIPVPGTSAGTPDTGENTGNNIGGNIAVMILPVVLAGLATLAYKRNINKTHRKFD